MIQSLDALRPIFQEREPELSELNSYPKENIKDLQKIKYSTLTLPKEFGGMGMDLYAFILGQEALAKASGATALSIGWHLGSILEWSEKRHWNDEITSWLTQKIKDGALINTAATEKGAGSPTRGAMPKTTAVEKKDVWLVSGEKSFTSLAPLIDYFFVTATIDQTDEVATFVIPHHTPGVSISETWDSVGMRGTASHDLIMDQVSIPKNYLLKRHASPKKSSPPAWLLHIPACYIGIAGAARDEAVSFASSFNPASLGEPIGSLSTVQQAIGEMEIELLSARQSLYHAAQAYSENEDKEAVRTLLQSTKVAVTNAAINIVDRAMRIVGPQSMSQSNPLHRYYADVRMGLHNPPMEDMVTKSLGEEAVRIYTEKHP